MILKDWLVQTFSRQSSMVDRPNEGISEGFHHQRKATHKTEKSREIKNLDRHKNSFNSFLVVDRLRDWDFPNAIANGSWIGQKVVPS